MTIFHKVAWQSLKMSRTRTAVTIIGIMLSAAMMTAVATFAVSLQNYLINGAIDKYGAWQVGFLDVDAAFVQECHLDQNVKDYAVYENIGYAELEGGKNVNKPYLFIAGFAQETFDHLPLMLISGRLPQNSNEIIVPSHVAANGGVKLALGDTFSLTVGNRIYEGEILGQGNPYIYQNSATIAKEKLVPIDERTYTVVGIYQRPPFEDYSAPGYTMITAMDNFKTTDRFSAFVTLNKPYQLREYLAATAKNHEYILNDNVLRFMGLSGEQSFNRLLYAVGMIVILLIMLGSIFMIHNTFNISLNERTHQFGILLSVGATEKQLRKMVLFEGLCLGAIGIPLGMLMGIPTIKGILSLVNKNFENVLYDTVPLTLSISFPALIAAAVVSLVTILISAYIPAKKAASVPIMTCIRQSNDVKIDVRAIYTPKTLEHFWGLEGALALKNFKRNRGRYRSVVLSLTLSVVFLIAASAFCVDLGQITERSTVAVDGDIIFETKNITEEDMFQLYHEMKAVDGVKQSTYQALSFYDCEVAVQSLTDEFWQYYQNAHHLPATTETISLSLTVQFIEDDIYQQFVKSSGVETALTNTENPLIIVGKYNGGLDIFTESAMTFTLNNFETDSAKSIQTIFVDTYPLDPLPVELSDVTNYVFMVVAPYQMKSQFDGLKAPSKMGFFFWSENPKASVEKIQFLLAGVGFTADYTLYNIHEILDQNRNMTFIVRLFTIVFVMMISLIAVANVFNTISTNIKLRRRELAMLRSVGMSDGDFNKMMLIECALYGLRTLLIGLPLSLLLSWLIYQGISLGGGEIEFVLPYGSIIVSMFGVFLIIMLTMAYTVSQIKKENIIDSLRDDMA